MNAIDQDLDLSGDEAMARFARGEDAAFSAVYAAVVPKLSCFIARRVTDRALVQDLVQETLLRVYRGRGTFAPGAAVMPWVLAIARRQLVDAHRSRRKETLVDREPPASAERHLRREAGPAEAEQIVDAKEVAAKLSEAFGRLPPNQRAAFELVKGQGLSLVAAARALGTSVTGVKLRTHRAYQKLRAELAVAA